MNNKDKIVEEPYEQRLKKVMAELQSIKHQLLSKNPHGLFEDLLEKAVN